MEVIVIMKGDIIKRLRQEKGYTLDDLAKQLNTTRQTIYKYENNMITNIPSDKIEKMAILFNVTPSYLMGWEDEDESPLGNYDENIKYLKESDQEELIELYEDILANDRLSILFDKAKQLSPEDLEQVLKIIDTFNKETR